MACSVCRRMGHKKPNCPVVEERNQKQIDRAITILQTIPIIINHPLVIAGIWLQLTKIYPEINALNNLIAVGEVIPAIDLNVPKGVVLGAMIDKTDDAINLFNDIRDFIEDYELPVLPTAEEIVEETVDWVTPDFIEDSAFLAAVKDCIKNAKKNLGWGYYIPPAAPIWVTSCLLQKGFDVPIEWVKRQI